jgi:hypothetical protein
MAGQKREARLRKNVPAIRALLRHCEERSDEAIQSPTLRQFSRLLDCFASLAITE